MLTKLKTLTNNVFIRNVFIVASGTAGAQAIGMLFSPIVTRIYGPEAFGLLGAFLAITNILSPISALAYPTAIVMPKSDSEARDIAKVSLLIALIMAAFIAIIIALCNSYIAEGLNLQSISHYLILIPLFMFFSVIYQVTQQWVIRKNQFKITARTAVLHTLILNSLKVSIGWSYPIAAVLIILSTLGGLLNTVLIWITARKDSTLQTLINIKSCKSFSILEVKSLFSDQGVAKKYRDFPLLQTPQALLNAAAESIPILMLASLYSPSIAGFYTLAKSIIMLPSSLVSKSVGDVFFPKLSEMHNNGINGRPLLLKSTIGLAAIGLIPLVTLILFGEILFGFVFGSEWRMSGLFASYLAIWVYSSFMNPPSVKAIIIYRKQMPALVLNVFTLALRVCAIYFGYYYFNDPVASLLLFAIIGVLHNATFIGLAFYFSGASYNEG